MTKIRIPTKLYLDEESSFSDLYCFTSINPSLKHDEPVTHAAAAHAVNTDKILDMDIYYEFNKLKKDMSERLLAKNMDQIVLTVNWMLDGEVMPLTLSDLHLYQDRNPYCLSKDLAQQEEFYQLIFSKSDYDSILYRNENGSVAFIGKNPDVCRSISKSKMASVPPHLRLLVNTISKNERIFDINDLSSSLMREGVEHELLSVSNDTEVDNYIQIDDLILNMPNYAVEFMSQDQLMLKNSIIEDRLKVEPLFLSSEPMR